MPQIAKVAVAAATYAIDKPYDYLVPQGADMAVGMRVLVPFGRGNRVSEGVVLTLGQGVPEKPIKPIRSLVDREPVITEREIRLALWMRERYFCTFYDAIRTILPAAVWYSYREMWSLTGEPLPEDLSERACRLLQDGPMERDDLCAALGETGSRVLAGLKKRGILQMEPQGTRKVQDKVVQIAALSLAPQEALRQMERKKKSAARQYDAVAFLAKYGEAPVQELCYYTGVSRQGVRSLERAGLLSLRSQEEYRITRQDYAAAAEEIRLNDEQQRAYEAVLAQTRSGCPGVTLLQGVTGSGKTLVYIRLAQTLLAEGRSVMILVPEIALTPQMMARFSAYFGDEVALLHSGLRMTERYDQFKRLRRGEAHIVLGTRSAVFAPLENLGLIIMDEEQEGSYQSENAPCYHARDVAKYRCAAEGARLLLGSATPTVETFYHAQQGEYDLLELTERYNRRALPEVRIADLRQELRAGNSTVISRPLQEELAKNIAAGEQSILFLNRRGSSRQLLCPQCGYVPECPRCSVYLTYHSANDRLMCHYCGYSHAAPTVCPECGGTLKHIGFGTQRVEEELHELFPGVEVLRMDADTVSVGHEALLKEFEERQIPILLGTQMVAKGLDFANVTLVGVLSADLSLYVDHYRAAERTFNLLTQVVGRAGRGDKAGRAVIQTYTPENDVIQAAAAQDYQRFYDAEITLRRLRQDPPFADQFTVTVTGPEETPVRRAIELLRQGIGNTAKKPPYDALGIQVIGPAPAPVVKVNGVYRYRLLVLGQNIAPIRELLAGFMRAFVQRPENRRLHIYTDCDKMD
mgnify:CR=1 FL=1